MKGGNIPVWGLFAVCPVDPILALEEDFISIQLLCQRPCCLPLLLLRRTDFE